MQAFVREFPVLGDEPVAGGSVLAGVGGAEFEVFREGRCLFLGAYGCFHFADEDEDGFLFQYDLALEFPSFGSVFVQGTDFGNGNRFVFVAHGEAG